MNLIDKTIEYLLQIKNMDKDERIRQLEAKVDFFQNKNGTIDDLFLEGKIDYEEYRRRFIMLNKKKNLYEFPK